MKKENIFTNMTNEDIVYHLEEFVKWSKADKNKVIKLLSKKAINNLTTLLKKHDYIEEESYKPPKFWFQEPFL